jgi:hypothetical protein
MRKAWFGWVVLFPLAAVLGCGAPSPDWNGTWKLNRSKSNFQGPTFTISISPDGEYRFDDGRSGFTFRCDGKDQPIGKNLTRACVKSSATGLDLIQKDDGVTTITKHWELSDGGSVFTVTATTFHSSLPVITDQIVNSRISGSNGFAGQWRDTTYLGEHAEITLKLDKQTLHIVYSSAGQSIDAPLDGVDTTVRGPHVPRGHTYAVRPAGPREFLTLSKRDGKTILQGSLELSGDGRSVTESWWEPGHPADKGFLVYEKQ